MVLGLRHMTTMTTVTALNNKRVSAWPLPWGPETSDEEDNATTVVADDEEVGDALVDEVMSEDETSADESFIDEDSMGEMPVFPIEVMKKWLDKMKESLDKADPSPLSVEVKYQWKKMSEILWEYEQEMQ